MRWSRNLLGVLGEVEPVPALDVLPADEVERHRPELLGG